MLASGSYDDTVKVWQTAKGKWGKAYVQLTTVPLWKGDCLVTIQHPDTVLAVVALPHSVVASGCYDHQVRLHTVEG